ncbi:hypothetical protein [Paenibacillus sp. NPDC057934]|uniref:hypothetical protein n=1 Tax=Paenibacillus sp. NPDC057934 TaxID=3346282 RepID=UPI0036DC49BB
MTINVDGSVTVSVAGTYLAHGRVQGAGGNSAQIGLQFNGRGVRILTLEVF